MKRYTSLDAITEVGLILLADPRRLTLRELLAEQGAARQRATASPASHWQVPLAVRPAAYTSAGGARDKSCQSSMLNTRWVFAA